MAKQSDSFFIRAQLNQPGTAYVTETIDLGSYVNLGQKSSTLLRVMNIEVQITDDNLRYQGPYPAGTNAVLNVGWDLTTQPQDDLVDLSDKSVVASGRYEVAVDANSTVMFASTTRDVFPQFWSNGYLIGVDSLYLNSNADQVSDAGAYNISIVMECVLETATQESAIALAIGQQ